MERARQFTAEGRYEEAVDALWTVYNRHARSDPAEARGLLEVATEIHARSIGRAQREARALIRNCEIRLTQQARPAAAAGVGSAGLGNADDVMVGRASRRALVGWTLLVGFIGFLIAGLFLLLSVGQDMNCLMSGTDHGWAAHGAVLVGSWAIGAGLWLLLSVLAWRSRRNLGVLLAIFPGSYLAGLIVLSVVARIVWGPDTCA